MSKKQDTYYFDSFIACTEYACKAAHLLEDIMCDFDPDSIGEKIGEMHTIEHSADRKKHEMLDVLAKAFITPIEREDIVQISQNIDNITDKIEDVLIRMYYNRVASVRSDAVDMAKVVVRCCEEVNNLMKEFVNFRRSKKLHDCIVQINSCEEEADKLYISCMYNLHESKADVFDVIAWREIYTYLEKCADAGEHVADVVESAVMKNS